MLIGYSKYTLQSCGFTGQSFWAVSAVPTRKFEIFGLATRKSGPFISQCFLKSNSNPSFAAWPSIVVFFNSFSVFLLQTQTVILLTSSGNAWSVSLINPFTIGLWWRVRFPQTQSSPSDAAPGWLDKFVNQTPLRSDSCKRIQPLLQLPGNRRRSACRCETPRGCYALPVLAVRPRMTVLPGCHASCLQRVSRRKRPAMKADRFSRIRLTKALV